MSTVDGPKRLEFYRKEDGKSRIRLKVNLNFCFVIDVLYIPYIYLNASFCLPSHTRTILCLNFLCNTLIIVFDLPLARANFWQP